MNEHLREKHCMEKHFFRASADDFKKIPGAPITYWANTSLTRLIENNSKLQEIAQFKEGITTANNDLFLRFWFEVNNQDISFGVKVTNDLLKWVPYNKGGSFRKWFGNNNYIVNWQKNGSKIKKYRGSSFRNSTYHFKRGSTFSALSSGSFGVRYSGYGYAFDSKGTMFFSDKLEAVTAYLNSKLCFKFLELVTPTLDYRFGTIQRLPFLETRNFHFIKLVDESKQDWDSYETSWDFTSLPMLQTNYRQSTMQTTYQTLRSHWQSMTLEMQQLEEENNRIFIEAYGLEDELTPEVPLEEITLTCNPHYRYGKNKSAAELEKLLLADTMKEYISYAVGCMFGRYSLDKEGLILANQGDTLQEYLSQIPEPAFMPDEDNVIPVLDDNWFVDDIVDRFYAFLRVTFGAERFNENVQFIEDAIGKNLRNFFVTDFYTDHVKRYKKRPIYWMFSSPKGSFNVLIYMHRYNEGTVSTILNNYLREFQNKLIAHEIQLQELSESSTARPADKTKALKEIQKVRKSLDEIVQWERNVIYPLATQRIVIDLDDGVKVNYAKFDGAVKKIPGLN